MKMSYRTISIKKDRSVCIISLNRPEAANAISRLMTRELDQAFDEACVDSDIKCIYLRGEGKNFSSGHDLGSSAQLSDQERPQEIDPRPRGTYLKWMYNDVEMSLKWRRLRKPIICGIKGYTIYHGTVVSACADICIAGDDLKYMPSLVEANLFPWVTNLQAQRVKEILFTQRFVLAPEAKSLGICTRVVPTSMLDDECMKLAHLIARSDGYHLWMMKKMINSAQDMAGLDTHVRASLDTWTAYRRDALDPLVIPQNKKTRDHGGNSKKLAPVNQSLKGYAWKLTEIGSKL